MKIKQALSYDDFTLFMTSLDETIPIEMMIKLFSEILYSTGMQLKDCLILKWNMVDYSTRTIKVNDKTYVFGSILDKMLKSYKQFDSSDFIFVSRLHKTYTRKYIFDKMVEFGKRVQLDVTPEVIRLSMIQHCIDNQMPIQSLIRILNISQNSMEKYLK